jgi:hypothetical protein
MCTEMCAAHTDGRTGVHFVPVFASALKAGISLHPTCRIHFVNNFLRSKKFMKIFWPTFNIHFLFMLLQTNFLPQIILGGVFIPM